MQVKDRASHMHSPADLPLLIVIMDSRNSFEYSLIAVLIFTF
jgi:hypothetical protein